MDAQEQGMPGRTVSCRRMDAHKTPRTKMVHNIFIYAILLCMLKLKSPWLLGFAELATFLLIK